ncbi:hypothetical protein ACFVYD_23360 [Streptomyces sp. NPDC058301]|uniref:hypothetical protein n=1 Tax=Streptomyces sp. NPDC058301 TaxID=3346436 RepID=UPI0036EBCFE0
MADEPDFTTLKDQYAARVTADLDANQQDQARIRAELDTLKGQLEALERDHGLLQTMQHTLGGTATAAAQASTATPTATRKRTTRTQPAAKASTPAAAPAPATTPTVASVPEPRKAAAQKPEAKAAKTTKATKAAKVAKVAKSPKKAATQAKKPARTSAESSGPTLREVVLGLFAGHEEPRTVADILTELTNTHPDRKTSPQVVRNTLEALVAKGELERERKQGSVFYTAHRDPAAAEKTDTPAAEAVDAPATAPEPAPATA